MVGLSPTLWSAILGVLGLFSSLPGSAVGDYLLISHALNRAGHLPSKRVVMLFGANLNVNLELY